jgi:hypothetical protein
MNTDDYEFIKGYENLYKINRNGDIYSCHYKKLMTIIISDDGYKYIDLSKKELIDNIIHSKRHKGRIHRLLALQYIPNPDNHPEVDHIDRNKINNSLDNLRWCTKITNRNNRPDVVNNYTPEQLADKNNRTRERARIWAEKHRRAIGCNIRSETVQTAEEKRAYKTEWMRQKRANMTPEEREVINARKRELRSVIEH